MSVKLLKQQLTKRGPRGSARDPGRARRRQAVHPRPATRAERGPARAQGAQALALLRAEIAGLRAALDRGSAGEGLARVPGGAQ